MFTPWNYISLALAFSVALSLVLIWLLWQERSRHSRLPDRWALVPRPVLSRTERQILAHLRETIPQPHIVLAKLPLVRFCQPLDIDRSRHWYELIGPCYVTFAVCAPDGRVLLVMDLEQRSAPSKRMEKIKSSVLSACRIKHLRLSPQHLPSAAELRNLLQAPARPVPRLDTAPDTAALGETIRQTSASLVQTLKSRRQGRPAFGDSRFAQDSFFAPLSNFGDLPNSPGHHSSDAPSASHQAQADETDTVPLESQQRLAGVGSATRPPPLAPGR